MLFVVSSSSRNKKEGRLIDYEANKKQSSPMEREATPNIISIDELQETLPVFAPSPSESAKKRF
jgi:hypothetical protein